MNEHKSLLLEIAETIDRRLPRRASQEENAPPPAKRRWPRWLVRQLVPNVGTLLMVVVLLLTIPSLAAPLQAPAATSTSTISYQGRLADSSGNPLTGKYNLEFRVYDLPGGGTPLWAEMWTGGNAADVSDGLFNVMLGSINNTLASAIEGQDELYLGITVGTDTEMTPRIQLGSVPFSMQALSLPTGAITTTMIADGAVTPAKLNLVDGNVGIGTAAPTARLEVQGCGSECTLLKLGDYAAGGRQYLQLDVENSDPPSTSCDEPSEIGRVFFRGDTARLFICTTTGPGVAWKSVALN